MYICHYNILIYIYIIMTYIIFIYIHIHIHFPLCLDSQLWEGSPGAPRFIFWPPALTHAVRQAWTTVFWTLLLFPSQRMWLENGFPMDMDQMIKWSNDQMIKWSNCLWKSYSYSISVDNFEVWAVEHVFVFLFGTCFQSEFLFWKVRITYWYLYHWRFWVSDVRNSGYLVGVWTFWTKHLWNWWLPS